VEVILSPIGLMTLIIYLPPAAGLVEGKVVFEYTRDSQVWGYFFGVSHLAYRIRPPPRPP